MKALFIDDEYFYYPEGVSNFEELNKYLKNHYSSFVELTKIDSTRLVPPYFIKEYTNKTYVNLQQTKFIEEVDISVMSKEDYTTSLNNAMDEICVHCDNFNHDKRYCECGDIQDTLCLNGKCDIFSKDEEF